MLTKFIEAMKQFGTPERTNQTLGVEYLVIFAGTDQTRLKNTLLAAESKKITIREFYQALGIDSDDTSIAKKIKKLRTPRDQIMESCLSEVLPYGTNDENIMSYQIPQELVEITRNRIQKEKTLLLNAYDELYHNPEIKFSPRRIIRKIKNNLSDFSVYVCTFGTTLIIRESDEELYKKGLTLAYQEARQKINANAPQIANAFLMALFKLEKETDILKKINLNDYQTKFAGNLSDLENDYSRFQMNNYNNNKKLDKLKEYQNNQALLKQSTPSSK